MLTRAIVCLSHIIAVASLMIAQESARGQHDHKHGANVQFSVRAVANGKWSEAKTWEPARVPGNGDLVLIGRGTTVQYDVASKAVIRLIQVVGTLDFARDRNTELNVAILKVQASDTCSESGFACDFRGVNKVGEPADALAGGMPTLLIGTPDEPIPASYSARIRLHFIEGMNREDALAIACCSARMEIMDHRWHALGSSSAVTSSPAMTN